MRVRITPATGVFAAMLVFWTVLFASYDTQFDTQHPGDGSYQPIRARGDGHYYYLYTLSLVLDRDLDIRNQCKTLGDPFQALSDLSPTGRPYMRPIGTSILQIPAFLVAHALATAGNWLGAGIATHGYTPWHQAITFYGNLLAGLFALWFAYRLARRHVSETAALYGVGFIGAGTGLLFYACYWASYNHTWSALFAAWFMEVWDRTRGRYDLRRYAALGALLGFLGLSRQQDAIFAVVPIVEGAAEVLRRLTRRDWRGALGVVAGGALAGVLVVVIMFPQLWIFQRQYGGWLAPAQDDQFMRFDSPFFWEVLYSTNSGLFTWTPIAYIAALGLLAAPRRARLTAAVLLVFFVLATYVTGATWAWWGGWSYGARRMLGVAGVLVAGMAFLVERLRALHARWPRVAPHAALLLALGPLVLINVELAGSTARFRQKTGKPQSAIDLYLGSTRRMAQGVQDVAGTPSTWPASWVWALRHGVSPKVYDLLVGGERLEFDPRGFRKRGTVKTDAIWVGKALGANDGGGWGPPVDLEARKVRWALPGRARILLPLHIDEGITLSLGASPAVAGPVRVAVNGAEMDVAFPAGFSTQPLPLPAGTLHEGTNDIDLRCPAAPVTGCLAVEVLTFTYRGN